MVRHILMGAVFALGLAGGAQAATVEPRIEDSAAELLFYSPTLGFSVVSNAPVATPDIDPVPSFAIVIGTVPGSTSVELTVEDAFSNDLLFATGTSFATGPGGITALLDVVTDATGLFGPHVRFNLDFANFDPSTPLNNVPAGLVIENVSEPSPEVIPLPAAAPLLPAALALLWGVRRRRAA